jgi:signal transduction histidine kinase
MPVGGTISIVGEDDGEEICLSVTDSGVGISDDDLEKLFEPLFTTKVEGVGLGLVTSRSLVEANGGRLTVETEPGVGSTFTLYFKKSHASRSIDAELEKEKVFDNQ